MNKVVNNQLLEAMRNLVTLFDSYISKYGNTPAVVNSLLGNTEPFLNSAKFLAAVKAFTDDPVMSTHHNALVGSEQSAVNCRADWILPAFIRWNHNRHQNVSFEELYEKFEDFFYTQDLVQLHTVNLYNFDMEIPALELSSDLRIRKGTERELDYAGGSSQNKRYKQSDFVIEVVRKNKKNIFLQNGSNPTRKENSSDLIQYVEEMDEVIRMLRFWSTNGVFRNNMIASSYGGFLGQLLTTGGGTVHENIVIGEKCQIKACDESELKTLWSKIASLRTDKRLTLAIKRLGTSIERQHLADQFIDTFVGLEAMFLPDGKSELTFRLSLRMGMMLGSNAREKQSLYTFIKDMYGIRSKLVHGEPVEIKPADCARLDKLYRKSLSKYINNPSLFTKQGLDDILFRDRE